jgi:hypothetical protein
MMAMQRDVGNRAVQQMLKGHEQEPISRGDSPSPPVAHCETAPTTAAETFVLPADLNKGLAVPATDQEGVRQALTILAAPALTTAHATGIGR